MVGGAMAPPAPPPPSPGSYAYDILSSLAHKTLQSHVTPQDKIEKIKTQIHSIQQSLPPCKQLLIYAGQQLENGMVTHWRNMVWEMIQLFF